MLEHNAFLNAWLTKELSGYGSYTSYEPLSLRSCFDSCGLRTPDDKPICVQYDSMADKCHFVHVCQLCVPKRPASQCKASAKDTQGEGAA